MSRTTSRTSPSPRARKLSKAAAALLAIVGGALALFAAWWLGTHLVYHPIATLIAKFTDQQRLERQVAAKRAERDALQSQIDFANTPAGAEAISRGQGYVKPGEHGLRMQIIPPKAAPAPAAPTTESNQRLFWYSLVGAFMAGFLALLVRWRLSRRHRAVNGTLRTREDVVKKRRFKPVRDQA